MDVHELRRSVKAADKFYVASKPVDEGIKVIRENYGTDDASARAFVYFIKGLPDGRGGEVGVDGKIERPSSVERMHHKFDEEKGDWSRIE
jgi:hypothetical protein